MCCWLHVETRDGEVRGEVPQVVGLTKSVLAPAAQLWAEHSARRSPSGVDAGGVVTGGKTEAAVKAAAEAEAEAEAKV